MPQLAALDKRYGKKGFQLIGIHKQSGTDEEILAVVKQTKVKFPIARTGDSPVNFSGIPHMFIFNPKGELVFEGHPAGGEADKVIRKELRNVNLPDDDDEDSSFGPKKDARAPLVAERTWTGTDGRTLIATLLSVENGTGKFKRKDGVSFSLPLAKLAPADQKVIEEAQAAATETVDDKDKDKDKGAEKK
jgi:hypothetical protein